MALQNVANTKHTRDGIADSSNRAQDDQAALQENASLTTDFTTSIRTWKLH
jgi:hypothetical protein